MEISKAKWYEDKRKEAYCLQEKYKKAINNGASVKEIQRLKNALELAYYAEY